MVPGGGGFEDEIGPCGECQGDMCEDCIAENQCPVCLQNGDDEESAMCVGCQRTCPKEGCNMVMHRKCRAEHLKVCNPKSRAKRAYNVAKEKVATIEDQIENAEHRLAILQEQLQEAKRAKQRAKNTLTRLSHK